MEKEKSKLRKLKRRFWSRKKNEDARRMNSEFQLDPGRVYASFKVRIESQGDCERPSYEHGQQDKEITQRLFTDVNEAPSFWKALWESEGDGNIEAEWLDEIRCVVRENISDLPEGSFELCAEQAKRVILKKRN